MRDLMGPFLAVSLLLGGMAVPLFAQDAERAERERVFDLLDQNGDGRISPDEVGTAQKKSFERLLRVGDKDDDGTLTRAEYNEGLKPPAAVGGTPQGPDRRPGGQGQPGDARELFRQFDRNRDGKLALSELPGAARDRLKPLFDQLKKEEITLEDLTRGRRQPPADDRESAEASFKRLDRNGDGKLAKSELPEQLQGRFRFLLERLKKDEITLQEYVEAARRASDPQALFNRFDRNKDGKLELSELPEPLQQRFKPIFDRTDKESLTQEEFTRVMRQRPQQPQPDRKRPTDRKRPANSDRKRP